MVSDDPYFILAFSFFTALTYAVLARRLEHQRPAIAMSGAVGLAMATGLVWWEYDRGVSVRDLGSVAVGFGVILPGMLLFQGIRQTGGSWAGAGIAFGASILVGWILGTPWPVATGVIQSLAIVGLVVGIIAYLLHRRDAMLHLHPLPRPAIIEPLDSRHDMSDLDEDCRVGDQLRDGLHRLRRQVYGMENHPEQANGVMQQIQKALPAEGWPLDRYGIPFLYEKPTLLREGNATRTFYPDFTLPGYGNLIVEYAGMPDRGEYMARLAKKQNAYAAAGAAAVFLYPTNLKGPDWPGRVIQTIRRAYGQTPRLTIYPARSSTARGYGVSSLRSGGWPRYRH